MFQTPGTRDDHIHSQGQYEPTGQGTYPVHEPSGYGPDISLRELLERWTGSGESLRAVMGAKQDEDRRVSEMQRTYQEQYRLETRRVELEILREAGRSRLPQNVIASIFASKYGDTTFYSLGDASPANVHWSAGSRGEHVHFFGGDPNVRLTAMPRIQTRLDPRQRWSTPDKPQPQYYQNTAGKHSGPMSAPPASVQPSSPPPSAFFRDWTARNPGHSTDKAPVNHPHLEETTMVDMNTTLRPLNQRNRTLSMPQGALLAYDEAQGVSQKLQMKPDKPKPSGSGNDVNNSHSHSKRSPSQDEAKRLGKRSKQAKLES